MSAEVIPIQWYPRSWASDLVIGDMLEMEDIEDDHIGLVVRADDRHVVVVWVCPDRLIGVARRVLKPDAYVSPTLPTG